MDKKTLMESLAGASFGLYKKGKTVTNPQNGIKIELPGDRIGTLKVVSSMGDTPETEISFCTYEGSGMGSSVRFIKKLCPTATVFDGTPIHGAEAQRADREAKRIADMV